MAETLRMENAQLRAALAAYQQAGAAVVQMQHQIATQAQQQQQHPPSEAQNAEDHNASETDTKEQAAEQATAAS